MSRILKIDYCCTKGEYLDVKCTYYLEEYSKDENGEEFFGCCGHPAYILEQRIEKITPSEPHKIGIPGFCPLPEARDE